MKTNALHSQTMSVIENWQVHLTDIKMEPRWSRCEFNWYRLNRVMSTWRATLPVRNVGVGSSYHQCFIESLMLTLIPSAPPDVFTDSGKHFRNTAWVLISGRHSPSCASSCFRSGEAAVGAAMVQAGGMRSMKVGVSGLLTLQIWWSGKSDTRTPHPWQHKVNI